MDVEKIIDCERSRIERWSNFQLAYKWKRVGLLLSLGAFATLVIIKFFEGDFLVHKFVLKRVLLIGLLIISLSKDKVEDEMIVSLRAKSLSLAFVLAVVYAIIQPFINVLVFYVVDYKDISNTFSYFQVLFFMLFIQILFFEVLKRNR